MLYQYILINSYNTIGPNSLGDINDDGIVDFNDVVLVQGYIDNVRTFTDDQIKRADVNKDGQITQEDADLINRYSVGM